MDPALEEGLSVPTEEDFQSFALMKAMAFAEKRGCCGSKADDNEKAASTIVTDELKSPLYLNTAKQNHCRVSKDEAGRVLGGIQLQASALNPNQLHESASAVFLLLPIMTSICNHTLHLQLPGDVGDLSFPEWMREDHLKPGEAHVEFIACHPDATGKGIGSKLLKWADAFAASNGCSFITLEVMAKNQGAARLYERKGYEIYHKEGECSCVTCCFVYCCLGCYYCRVYSMMKDLSGIAHKPEGQIPPGQAEKFGDFSAVPLL